MSPNPSSFSRHIDAFYKHVTLGIFYLLPKRVTSTFITLSIVALIYHIKSVQPKWEELNSKKFHDLLNVSFNEEIMVLPNYTLNWFWTPELLQQNLTIENKTFTLSEAIQNNEILFGHLRTITDHLLNCTPKSVQRKLHLDDARERMVVKHGIMDLLVHS